MDYSVSTGTQTELDSVAVLEHITAPVNTVSEAIMLIGSLPEAQQLQTISDLFHNFLLLFHDVCIRPDFLELALNASRHLKQCNRSNIIYKLAKVIGTMRPDKLDSRLPAKRMPMGLLEYIANFYDAENYQKV